MYKIFKLLCVADVEERLKNTTGIYHETWNYVLETIYNDVEFCIQVLS